MNILTVIGARPQFIKAAVLSRYIRDNQSINVKETIVHTGQHYDNNMSEIFFKEMDIPAPEINLETGSGSHGKMTGAMLSKIESILLDRKPDVVLVYGGTNSTLAGALAASKLNIPVAHVEAGLRSYMMIMPEEQNRRLTDNLSTWLFCPTDTAVQNLEKEGISNAEGPASSDSKKVSKTGDIMFDASLFYRKSINNPLSNSPYILATIHRAENTDSPKRLESIVNAFNDFKDKEIILPLHPRTKKIMSDNNLHFEKHIKVIQPVGYLEMLSLEQNCDFVITDSGGVQKEAYFFKKPCLTIRDSTEWIELVESGWNTLVKADTVDILHSMSTISKPSNYPDLYGDGKCAEKIISTLTGGR